MKKLGWHMCLCVIFTIMLLFGIIMISIGSIDQRHIAAHNVGICDIHAGTIQDRVTEDSESGQDYHDYRVVFDVDLYTLNNNTRILLFQDVAAVISIYAWDRSHDNVKNTLNHYLTANESVCYWSRDPIFYTKDMNNEGYYNINSYVMLGDSYWVTFQLVATMLTFGICMIVCGCIGFCGQCILYSYTSRNKKDYVPIQ